MEGTAIEPLQMKAQRLVAKLGYGMNNYRHPLRAPMWNRVCSIWKTIRIGTTPLECAEIASFAAGSAKISGDIAEAGVFLGGTAAIILESIPNKTMHLFDTFEGFPESEGRFKKGGCCGSLEATKVNLKLWSSRVSFHPGFFPDSAIGLEDLRFSFVHLDLDLYQSTIDALRWFWPRLNPGGVLLSHDYPLADGVVRAFDEFFADVPACFFPLSGNQCVAVKAC